MSFLIRKQAWSTGRDEDLNEQGNPEREEDGDRQRDRDGDEVGDTECDN